MTGAFRPRTIVLFLGDIFFFGLSLWLSLLLRSLSLPSGAVFEAHLAPFSLLFVAWVVVFFIAGLYESRSLLLARRALSASLLWAQVANVIIAALFFFFVPIFGIAPKTLLLIYLLISFLLVLFWRALLFPRLGLQRPEDAVLIGESPEAHELAAAIGHAPRAPLRIASRLPMQDLEPGVQPLAPLIIADLNDRRIAAAFPNLYNLLQRGVRFIDLFALYEEFFGRIPLSSVTGRWVVRNVSVGHALYDVVKRLMDIAVALPAALISLVLYPFIALALKIQDGGAIVISMPRVGQGGQVILMHKFRSMTGNDSGNWGTEGTELRITPVGKFLRISRLDELPQLWDVVAGSFSLIGPRPEFPKAVAEYEKEIPYYGVRHLIKPGLSGWAQLYHDNHPHHGTDIEATREKLSYDLYYLKHRSLLLDSIIVLKTLKKLLTRSGV